MGRRRATEITRVLLGPARTRPSSRVVETRALPFDSASGVSGGGGGADARFFDDGAWRGAEGRAEVKSTCPGKRRSA